jgi:hypothetical protein
MLPRIPEASACNRLSVRPDPDRPSNGRTPYSRLHHRCPGNRGASTARASNSWNWRGPTDPGSGGGCSARILAVVHCLRLPTPMRPRGRSAKSDSAILCGSKDRRDRFHRCLTKQTCLFVFKKCIRSCYFLVEWKKPKIARPNAKKKICVRLVQNGNSLLSKESKSEFR